MTQMRGTALKNGEKWVKLEYGLRQKQDCGLVDHGVWAVSFQVTQETSGFHMRLMDASGDSSLRQDVWGRHRLEVGWEGSQERDLVRFEAAVRQVGAQSFGNWRA